MTDAECVDFLQWSLPRLHLRWRGFRKVRRQVCKRLRWRLASLGLADLDAYRAFLDQHTEEWTELDALCRITISRFGRDRGIWQHLADEVLPSAARAAATAGRRTVKAWSAGCCGGEEPYTLAITWQLAVAPRDPAADLSILATDVDPAQIERAQDACYAPATLRELPPKWREAAFVSRDGHYCLRDRFRQLVRFAVHDLREPAPEGAFDIILCRNVAFTYFDQAVQRSVADNLRSALAPDGVLVIGAHEDLPRGAPWIERGRCVFAVADGHALAH